ncbi:MAG: hypothetical protein RIQ60_4526 [Pseudomonadota bacterium]
MEFPINQCRHKFATVEIRTCREDIESSYSLMSEDIGQHQLSVVASQPPIHFYFYALGIAFKYP